MESPSRRACLQTLHLEPHIQGNAGKIAPHGMPRTKWPQKPWHDCRAQANLFDAACHTIRMEREFGTLPRAAALVFSEGRFAPVGGFRGKEKVRKWFCVNMPHRHIGAGVAASGKL
jgi:hypothetical protein